MPSMCLYIQVELSLNDIIWSLLKKISHRGGLYKQIFLYRGGCLYKQILFI